MKTRSIILLVVVLTLCITSMSMAQTLHTLDGAALSVDEITGPPAGPCLYPNGPVVASWPYAMPFVCPLPGPPIGGPPPGGIFGGMASDPLRDTVYITDGDIIGEYSATGLPLNGWFNGVFGPTLTAMAYDSLAGVLFFTDGFTIVGVIPPPPPGCVPGTIVVFPWPYSPAPNAPLTGMTWDPTTGSLWGIDALGLVWNIPVGGPGVPVWPALPDPICGMLGPPQGLAFDIATPNPLSPPSIYITDGFIIAYSMIGAPAPAPPTFYTTAPCIPVPGSGTNGLAYTSHGITYSFGTDPAGFNPPMISSTGQFVSGPFGSGPISISILGADPTPGTVGGLFYTLGPAWGGGGAACPQIPGFSGNLISISPPFFGPIGPFPLVFGNLTLPGALPPGLPPGLDLYMQWFVKKGSGGRQVSDALEFTIGLP